MSLVESILALRHINYVATAYGLALLVIGGLVIAVILDRQAQRRALSRLQGEGAPPDPLNGAEQP